MVSRWSFGALSLDGGRVGRGRSGRPDVVVLVVVIALVVVVLCHCSGSAPPYGLLLRRGWGGGVSSAWAGLCVS